MKNLLFGFLVLILNCHDDNFVEETLVIIKEKEGWHNPNAGDFVGYLCISINGEKFIMQTGDVFKIDDQIYGKFTKPILMTWIHNGATKTVKLVEIYNVTTTKIDVEQIIDIF